jgi:hypothetical protein
MLLDPISTTLPLFWPAMFQLRLRKLLHPCPQFILGITRYMTAYPIGVVGRVTKSTPTDLWTNHLLAFKSNGIPTEIDMQELQYINKKRDPWVIASYSNIARGNLPATMTDTTIANTSSQ